MESAPSLISISHAGAGTYRNIKANQPFLIQAWLPALLFCSVFALESTAAFGSDHTSRPLHNLLHLLLGSSSLGQSLSLKMDQDWSHLHHILRKASHFLAYGIFSLICYRGLSITLRTTASRLQHDLSSHALAVTATILVASADEFHQTFLPNRTGSLSDVLLDTAGAIACQLTLFLILYVRQSHRTPSLQLNIPNRMPTAA